MELAGKVVVVTGAANGLGLSCADKCLSYGATVIMVDRDFEKLGKNALAFRDRGFSPIEFVLDVCDEERIVSFAHMMTRDYASLDVLINSAGIQTYGTAPETSSDLWDRTLNVNVKSMFLMAKHLIPLMKKSRQSSIVNISSVQSLVSQKGVLAYSTSKGAINAFTRALAIDHAFDGIRVNAVLPGSVDTPMLRAAADLFKGEKSIDEVLETWGKGHPLGRVGKSSEIAELVVFLASDRSSFITGSCYVIDGGLISQVPVVLPE